MSKPFPTMKSLAAHKCCYKTRYEFLLRHPLDKNGYFFQCSLLLECFRCEKVEIAKAHVFKFRKLIWTIAFSIGMNGRTCSTK